MPSPRKSAPMATLPTPAAPWTSPRVSSTERTDFFAKDVEWLDLQKNIAGTVFFRSCDSNPPQLSPASGSPRKAGTQRRANGKTVGKLRGNAINRDVPDLGSRFRGNDEKRDCVETLIQKNLSVFSQVLQPVPQKEDALLGSPISRLARVWFDPLVEIKRLCRRLSYTFARVSIDLKKLGFLPKR
jgi:hypothetical protein